jgi:arylsulfatase A-like enzyme
MSSADSLTRRTFVQSAAAGTLLAGLPATRAAAQPAPGPKERPNVLFILVDQLRYDTLGCAGHPMIRTPNIDRLASQGARMANCYAQCAVCGPSRASMLTGHSVAGTGVLNHTFYGDDFGHLMPQQTFDEVLADAGYTAEYHGKWHCPLHRARVYQNAVTAAGIGETEFGLGLERSYGRYMDQHVPRRDAAPGEQIDNGIYHRPYTMDPIDSRWGQPPSDRVDDGSPDGRRPLQPDNHGNLHVPDEHSITAMEGRNALDAITRLGRQDQPFTLHIDFWLPHTPVVVTDKYYGMYPVDEVPLPESLDDPMDNTPYAGANGRKHITQYADPEKIKYFISNYYGVVTEVDDWVGKILDTLDDQGLSDNTLVVFCSDHGEMLGAHGMREKNVFYEESAHVPAIVRLPGRIDPGRVCKTVVSQVDLFATILDYCGVEAPENHGRSWRRLFEGAEEPDAGIVTEWHFHPNSFPNYMIRQGQWKYLTGNRPGGSGIDCLYDLEADPHEMHNLIGRNPGAAQHEPTVGRLRETWSRWADATDLGRRFRDQLETRPRV